MKCEKCIHYGICVVNSYCHEPCGYYEEDRPHGEWVLDKEFSFVFNIYECSKCRFNGSKRWHFCPNCGASMQANDGQVTGKLDENTQKHYGFRKKY